MSTQYTVEVHDIVTTMLDKYPISSDAYEVERTGPYELKDAVCIAVQHISHLAYNSYVVSPMMGTDFGWHCQSDGDECRLLTIELVEVKI